MIGTLLIGNCTNNSGNHGEFGVSVRANDGIHGQTEHIEGDAQSEPKEILIGKCIGLFNDFAAKQSQNRLHEDQIESHNDDV